MASLLTEFSVNWRLDGGADTAFHEHHNPSLPVIACHPAIYRRHDGSKRCTIDMRMQHGMQATLHSNAKSCEVYWVNAHGEQEYQGSVKAEYTSTDGWKLNIAAKVGLTSCMDPSCTRVLCLPEELDPDYALLLS